MKINNSIATSVSLLFLLSMAAMAQQGNFSQIGVFRPPSGWILDSNSSGAYDSADKVATFGAAGDIPVVGDWDGTGVIRIGVFRCPQSGTCTWILDQNNNGTYDAGDIVFQFGAAGDIPVVGDWNGNNISKVGVMRCPSACTWYLDVLNKRTPSDPSFLTWSFGVAGDLPAIGPWSGAFGVTSLLDNIGVFRAGTWILDSANAGNWVPRDITHSYGAAGDIPVVGKWGGFGSKRIGVFRGGQWILDSSGDFAWESSDTVDGFGVAGDKPVVGQWNFTSGGGASPTLARPTSAVTLVSGLQYDIAWIPAVPNDTTTVTIGSRSSGNCVGGEADIVSPYTTPATALTTTLPYVTYTKICVTLTSSAGVRSVNTLAASPFGLRFPAPGSTLTYYGGAAHQNTTTLGYESTVPVTVTAGWSGPGTSDVLTATNFPASNYVPATTCATGGCIGISNNLFAQSAGHLTLYVRISAPGYPSLDYQFASPYYNWNGGWPTSGTPGGGTALTLISPGNNINPLNTVITSQSSTFAFFPLAGADSYTLSASMCGNSPFWGDTYVTLPPGGVTIGGIQIGAGDLCITISAVLLGAVYQNIVELKTAAANQVVPNNSISQAFLGYPSYESPVDDSGQLTPTIPPPGLSGGGTPVTVSLLSVASHPSTGFVINNNTNYAYTFGVKIKSDVAGQVSAIRFYRGVSSAGHGGQIASIFDVNGNLLGQATSTDTTNTAGWQQINLASPVNVSANAVYVYSVTSKWGSYNTSGYLASAGVDTPPLHLLQANDAAGDGPNGVYSYVYGNSAVFPSLDNYGNYPWIDIVFTYTPSSGNLPVAAQPSNPAAPAISNTKRIPLPNGRFAELQRGDSVDIGDFGYSFDRLGSGYKYTYTLDNTHLMSMRLRDLDFLASQEVSSRQPAKWRYSIGGWLLIDGLLEASVSQPKTNVTADVSRAPGSSYELMSDYLPGLTSFDMMGDDWFKLTVKLPGGRQHPMDEPIISGAMRGNKLRRYAIGPVFAPGATQKDVLAKVADWAKTFAFLKPLISSDDPVAALAALGPSTDLERDIVSCLGTALGTGSK